MAKALRYTVIPEKDTLITAQVSPDAVCKLHLDAADEEQHLKLYADADGIVRIHVHPHAPCDEIVEFTLESEEGVQHRLCLRAAHEPSAEHPFHVPIEVSQEGARVRPALTVHEAETLSNEELVRRGYTPRPEIQGVAGTPDAWLRSVTTPYTWVNARTVARPDRGRGYAVRRGNGNSSSGTTLVGSTPNWSGFELDAPAGSFSAVMGAWQVPSVTAFGLIGNTSSLVWVGIDGDNLADLVQAGTGQDITHKFIFGILWTLHSNYGWTEFLPQQQTLQVVSNFVVHPGDQVFVEVSLLGFAGIPSPTGDRAQFILRNDTTNKIAQVDTLRGTTNVISSEAVWIVERPLNFTTKTFIPLSNYGTVTISSAQAQIGMNPSGTANWFNYTLGQPADDPIYNTVQISMRNDAGTADISTVAEVDESTMTFTWKGAS